MSFLVTNSISSVSLASWIITVAASTPHRWEGHGEASVKFTTREIPTLVNAEEPGLSVE
jgi:hypothetical protein